MDEERSPLTPTQANILLLKSGGFTRAEIGRCLGKRETAIKDSLERSRRKLSARNTTHAIVLATRQGWL